MATSQRGLVKRVLKDAEAFVARSGVKFTKEGMAVFRETEEFAHSLNDYVYPWTYFTVIIRRVKRVRAAIARHGIDPDSLAAAFDAYTREVGNTPTTSYGDYGPNPYSDAGTRNRKWLTRAHVIDLAIQFAQRENSAITDLTLFEALLAHHDLHYPSGTNGVFTDERLHTPHNTLAHVFGRYEPALFSVKLSDLRNDLGFPHTDTSSERPVDLAPPSARAAIHAFLVDHPDYQRNCFLVMPFGSTRAHNEIARTLRRVMKSHGFNLVRADDHVYSEDLLRGR